MGMVNTDGFHAHPGDTWRRADLATRLGNGCLTLAQAMNPIGCVLAMTNPLPMMSWSDRHCLCDRSIPQGSPP